MSSFINKKSKSVLIHIPKTAGTSIRRGVWNNNYQKPIYGPLPHHITQNYFCFAFVRNPYDRICSTLRMFRDGTQNTTKNKKYKPRNDLTITDILDITMDPTINFGKDRNTFEEILKHHSIPMLHPFNSLNQAHYIGRYETLINDWTIISQLTNQPAKELPNLNYTKKTHYKKIITNKEKTKIEQVYKQDLIKFNYKY